MRVRKADVAGALLVALGSLGDCSTSPRSAGPFTQSRLSVEAVELGRAIGRDKRVSEPAVRFRPADTIFAAVVTSGQLPEANVKARWSFEGTVVDETTARIAPSGTTVTEFHVYDPAGWKPGRYRVEVFLDD